MGKTGVPGGNPHYHRENMHSPHRKALPQARVEPFLQVVGNSAHPKLLPAWDQTHWFNVGPNPPACGVSNLMKISQNSSIPSICTSTTRWPWNTTNSTTNMMIVQVNHTPLEVKPLTLLLNCSKKERECRTTLTRWASSLVMFEVFGSLKELRLF